MLGGGEQQAAALTQLATLLQARATAAAVMSGVEPWPRDVPRRLLVGNLPAGCDAAMLGRHMEKYDSVAECNILPLGVAYVNMWTWQGTKRVLEAAPLTLQKQPLIVMGDDEGPGGAIPTSARAVPIGGAAASLGSSAAAASAQGIATLVAGLAAQQRAQSGWGSRGYGGQQMYDPSTLREGDGRGRYGHDDWESPAPPVTAGPWQDPAGQEQESAYFVIRSHCIENVRISVERGLWATGRQNETAINNAFSRCKTVFLIFSVNGSGQFCGYATVAERIPRRGRESDERARELGLGGRWANPFSVEWIKVGSVGFAETNHLVNPYNHGTPIKRSRDGQALPPDVGTALLRLIDDAHAAGHYGELGALRPLVPTAPPSTAAPRRRDRSRDHTPRRRSRQRSRSRSGRTTPARRSSPAPPGSASEVKPSPPACQDSP
eukprot:TRINITY_DN30518_c0_g1_i1.p1 TRINITY_DN30518_c0_g1~~TRINITY_DN30518_c0_g1_i1.p1  ORF type:complete len:435 (+),score=65.92 TRINITY_DN30518_c0_g1_i1:111-1415(+)